MLDNVSYNKAKLMHQIAAMQWFIEKHALKDAQSSGDSECYEMLITLQKDLQKSLERLQTSVCTVLQ